MGVCAIWIRDLRSSACRTRYLGLDGNSIKCKSCDALMFFVIFIKWNRLVDGWMDDL